MTLTANWRAEGGESRTEEYRTWRTVQGLAGVCDVDQVEYQLIGGKAVPVAVIEVCVADMQSEDRPAGVRPGKTPSPLFFDAVIAKVSASRPQGMMLREVAARLSVPLLLLVYVHGCLEDMGVWVYRIGGTKGWQRFSLSEYRKRLEMLRWQPSTR